MDFNNLRITPQNLISLKENEVFVFGTNKSGFHGAGSAGYAMRGTTINNWRNDINFLNSINANVGSDERIGKWAVYGISKGLMYGKEGKSYGITTIIKAGDKRSQPLELISDEVKEFTEFAKSNNHLTFYVTEIGTNLAGYGADEIAPFFNESFNLNNVYLPKTFIEIILTLI